MEKYSASYTNVCTKNEMGKITVTPYQVGTVNHAIKNKN